MKGFWKRDLMLLWPTLRLYLVLMAVLAVFFLVTRTNGVMLVIYIFILGQVGSMSVFNQDNQTGWMAYAAAMPGGRRGMVAGRYLCTLTLWALTLVLQLLLTPITGMGLAPTFFLAGVMLLSASLMDFFYYLLGPAKALIPYLILLALSGAVGGGAAATSEKLAILAAPLADLLALAAAAALLAGVGVFVLCWWLSARLMVKKEL